MDLIHNGQARGDVASLLLNNNFDVSALRPWVGKDGRHYIARREAGKLIPSLSPTANATLRHEEWKLLDEAIIKAARQRMRILADLRGSGLVFNIPNGMGKTVLETESISDITAATVSMDPSRQGEGDRPDVDLVNLPLPVIHKDFHFNARQIATSRNSGSPLDTTMAELASRKVIEEAEKITIGTNTGITYGGGTVYGLTNFPKAITSVSLTAPTVSNWTPKQTVTEVLAMRQASEDARHYGPWVLYNSPAWDQYLDEDYSDTKGDNTLRDRLKKIQGIQDVRTLDFLSNFRFVLVQQTSDVIRLVIGMDVTTVQWESLGGMRLNYKVMAILVPQLRADYNDNTGIVSAYAAE